MMATRRASGAAASGSAGRRWPRLSPDAPAYGQWSLVIPNSAVFLIFGFSFLKPQIPRDWRTFGAFAAFVVALFAEMYVFLGAGFWLLSSAWNVRAQFGDAFERDARSTPRFIPSFRSKSPAGCH